jgi:hypothetical protein
MSLQDEIRIILFNKAEVFLDFEKTADLVINKVLDAAVEAIEKTKGITITTDDVDVWEYVITKYDAKDAIQALKVDESEEK